jgi:glycerol kinase
MMTAQFILAIDQGTTGSTVMVVDVTEPSQATVVGRHTVDFPQHYPRTGWVEHDLEDIWGSVRKAATQAMAQAVAQRLAFDAKKIVALGITNQRETLCVFERETAKPLGRAIVWQDKRSAGICTRLKAAGIEARVKDKTGLVLDPYFSGTKLTWLMESEPDIARRVSDGRAVCGTIDTYLIARLTGGQSFVTEPSNASRTLLFDIGRGGWDSELLDALGVPRVDALPEVRDSAGAFGKTRGLDFLPDGIPITGVLGDQQAALAGQTCFTAGEGKCTYGTGAFFLLNLGDRKLASRAGCLTTVAWSLGRRLTYAFEGSAFVAGAAVQFLRDQLGIIASAAETGAMASGATAAPEVYFVPALAGLGAPYWDPKAQGAFFGLTRGTTRAQLVRAALEGVAFTVNDLVQAMRADLTAPIKALRVDGGAAANDLLMQAQADYAGIEVDRPQNLETTAFGAALFAGLGAGVYSDLTTLRGVRKTERVFKPVADADGRAAVSRQLAGWQRAVKAVQLFAGSGAAPGAV